MEREVGQKIRKEAEKYQIILMEGKKEEKKKKG